MLSMIRKTQFQPTIIHFYEQLKPEVEAVIKGWDLEVLSWRPARWYLAPWLDDAVLVSEYAFGDGVLPVLTDIIDGEDCDWERRSSKLTESFHYPFDLTVWGYRRADELHPAMPPSFPREFQLGPTRMVAPLYGETDEGAMKAVRQLPFAPVTSDAIRMCAKCREGLASWGWDREASLKFFAERFGYARAA